MDTKNHPGFKIKPQWWSQPEGVRLIWDLTLCWGNSEQQQQSPRESLSNPTPAVRLANLTARPSWQQASPTFSLLELLLQNLNGCQLLIIILMLFFPNVHKITPSTASHFGSKHPLFLFLFTELFLTLHYYTGITMSLHIQISLITWLASAFVTVSHWTEMCSFSL